MWTFTVPVEALSPKTVQNASIIRPSLINAIEEPQMRTHNGEMSAKTTKRDEKSESGSEDASKSEKKWKPKSLRAEPTDADPFGDAEKLLELSPLPPLPTIVEQNNVPMPLLPSLSTVTTLIPTNIPNTFIASPVTPLTFRNEGVQIVTAPPQTYYYHPLTQSQQQRDQHEQERRIRVEQQQSATIIVIPSTLADSVSNSTIKQGPSVKTVERTPLSPQKSAIKSTGEYNNLFRKSANNGASNSNLFSADEVSTSLEKSKSSLESAKMHILSRPQLLLNVFTFWINLIACHGTVNHNQCVYAMLNELKQHFAQLIDKKRKGGKIGPKEEERVATARRKFDLVLDDLRNELDNRSYDTTRSIVDATNIVGPYVLRHFLLKKGVISKDVHKNDTAVVWASLIASSDPTLPFEDTRKITDPAVMLERMAWSKRVSIPGV